MSGKEITLRIGYGYKRSDDEFIALGCLPDKIFIDGPGTDGEDLRALLVFLKGAEIRRPDYPDFVVVLVNTKDVGKGVGVKNFREQIEALGAKVEGPKERDEASQGRNPKVRIDEDTESAVCLIWAQKYRPEKARIEAIVRKHGVSMDRDQLNYMCIRKPKLQAQRDAKRK